jgi:carbon-monoxide dehydrogenase medium subunit
MVIGGMKPPPFAYVAPRSLDEALALLARHGDDAKVLAGGQSLVPALNLRMMAPAVLVDINRVPELGGILQTGAEITLGALTRHRQLERDPAIARAVPMLASAAPHIAHLPIRSRGTMGGSLSHADPAAELAAVCLACDATMVLRGPGGEREVPAAQFNLGVFTTALAPGELLVAIRFPAWPATRPHGFQEVARRHGDFAICGAAVTVDLQPDGRCGDARIVIFGAADRPLLRPDAAAALQGQTPTLSLLREVAELAAEGLDPGSDLHASADYRRRVAPSLVRRALAQALTIEDRRQAA